VRRAGKKKGIQKKKPLRDMTKKPWERKKKTLWRACKNGVESEKMTGTLKENPISKALNKTQESEKKKKKTIFKEKLRSEKPMSD